MLAFFVILSTSAALPGVLGIWGEGSFIFRDFGKWAINFQGSGEQAKNFGVFGSRELGSEEKHFRALGKKVIFLSGSRELRPPVPRLGLLSSEILLLTNTNVFKC